ncbi:hypothetical protein QFC21_006459 [Naganishia friedmannii]|uniref:Uncharacterized protein n=1 Tax=Naganishia friedmannii TaxID=89922 RepID=A0ACC2V264_9TREE|nr:hypothetical protein QFC21_006459 [Naganishia friedmannii]
MASPTPNGTSATTDAPKTKTAAADVGWQFVPQYYTTLHDAPERLHCFYNKKSTFVHGVEGEDIIASYGQHDIHQKVLSLGFSDCKAYIHHIDAQTSFAGGIILQVIGEISNKSGPWRKFTQTFFLAEQPSGYFVLNDIFRYLKEDDEEDVGEEQDVESAVEEVHVPEVEQAVESKPEEATPSAPAEAVHSVAEPIKVDSDIVLTNGQPPVSDLAESAPAAKLPESATNNLAEKPTTDVPESSVDAPQEAAPTPAPVETPREVKEEKPAVEEKPAPVKEETPVPTLAADTSEPTLATAQQQPVQQQKPQQSKPAASQRQPSGSNKQNATPPPAAQQQQQQQSPASSTPAPAAAPAAPPKPVAPRTWASTAAAKPNAWGTALATKEALSATTQAQQRPAAQRNPSSQQPQPAQSAQPQQQQAPQQAAVQGKQPQGSARFPLVDAARQVQTPICFVKLNNWQAPDGSQPLGEAELRQILSKYGEITKVEIVRDKACAFVEFAKLDSARKAIIASLLNVQGGDGGIKTVHGHRIIVESRKEKSERKAGSVTPAPAQGQQTQPLPPPQQAQGQGAKRQQGQAQNGNNHNQNQQNQNQRGGMKGGRGGKTGQASQAGNAK